MIKRYMKRIKESRLSNLSIYKIGKIKNIKNGTQPYGLNKISMRIYIIHVFLPIFNIAHEIYENKSMF